MKIKNFFCILILASLSLGNAYSQNAVTPKKQPVASPKLPTPKVEKTAEQLEYEEKFKALTPAQKSKFDEVNREYFKKMMESVNSLNNEANRIAKINSPLAIINRIFPALTQQNANSTPFNEATNKIYDQYLKLDANKKRLIKIELVKFRKIANKNEVDRAVKMKEIFRKDYFLFKPSEDVNKILEDEKALGNN